MDYFAAINPAVVRFVDGDSHRVQQVYERLGGAPLYYLRNWALSEQKDDMRADPEGTGRRHAQEWARDVDAFYSFLPRDRILVSPINEPEVWVDFSCVPYNVAFLDACAGYGLRGAALQLSVGWPANTGPDTPPDWGPYAPVQDAILRGNHVLSLNEYWDERGPEYNWGWWAGRYTKCPWDVPIIIGECGIDKYVSDPGVPEHMRGWQGWMGGDAYAGQVEQYLFHLAQDKRMLGACLYTTDYGSPWQSFDTLPAHGWLSAIYVEAGDWWVDAPSEPPAQPEPEPPTETEPVPPTGQPAPGVVHPCPGAGVTQDFYQNEAYYEQQFGLPGHDGTDFATPFGTPVRCVAAGEVAFSGYDVGYGNYVRVWHPGLVCHSHYSHLSQSFHPIGAQLSAGEEIGLSGDTGNTLGAHLHVEIRLGTRDAYREGTPMSKGRIDPRTWLAMQGVAT